jgi:hypothetical protein
MRNRNVKSSLTSAELSKHVIARNPFDMIERAGCYLACSSCGNLISPWALEVRWVNGYDEITSFESQESRIKRIIEYNIANHKCLQKRLEEKEKRISEAEMMSGRIKIDKPKQIYPGLSLRCSGYGVFVNGEKCPGCPDCNVSDELKELRKGVDFLLNRKPMPQFSIGMWVINTDTGDIWQVNETDAANFNATPKENIKPYL